MQAHRSMYRSISNILFFLVAFAIQTASAQVDTAKPNAISGVKPAQHQLRIGIDLTRPVMGMINSNRHSFDIMVDYSLPKEVYAVFETGFGGSDIDYPDLKYTSSNSFFKLGIDRSMLQRMFPQDWDLLFVGLRYGVGFIKRSEATFVTEDDLWGTTTGTIPSKNMTAHWAELTAGLRVELFKGFFTGYTIRAKFLLNQGPFRELPPAYIAGYGKAEKNSVFDFNFYLQYGIRW
jgi:hypothetical protein